MIDHSCGAVPLDRAGRPRPAWVRNQAKPDQGEPVQPAPAAALRSDRGASRQLLLAAFAQRYVLLASVPLMMEYEAVLVRPEHLEAACLSAGDVNEILAALAATVEPVRLAFLWRPMLRDPADEMILETAANGRADLLVTFNIRHFTQAAGRFGIDVVSPPEAWRRLRKVQ